MRSKKSSERGTNPGYPEIWTSENKKLVPLARLLARQAALAANDNIEPDAVELPSAEPNMGD